MPTIRGTSGNDTLNGTNEADVIYGLEGDDIIDGGVGADLMYGGAGADTFRFSALQFSSPAPTAIGLIDGGDGIDTIDWRNIAPITLGTIQNTAGNYVLGAYVGSQRFEITGVERILFGGSDDTISPAFSAGGLEIRAGGGSDTIYANAGDQIFGEDGNDRIWLSGAFGGSVVTGSADGGSGIDTLRTNIDFVVDMASGTAKSGNAVYAISGFENLEMSLYNSPAQGYGDDKANVMTVNTSSTIGNVGVIFDGRGGDDNLTGSTFADQLSGGSGNDIIRGGAGNDRIDGGTGYDLAVFSQDFAAASITTRGSSVVVSGTDGVDTLSNVEALRFSDGQVAINSGDPFVDSIFYLKKNFDVYRAGVGAAMHFQQFGASEGRNPNAFFSISGYLSLHPGIAAKDAVLDYHNAGWRQGADPSVAFDTKLYLLHNKDVAAAGIDPLQHFLTFGQAEGRSAYKMVGGQIAANGFDRDYYLMTNPDVAKAGIDPAQHYAQFGWREGRDPNAFFDTSYYLDHNKDVAEAGINPLDHFHNFGWREDRDPSATVDISVYFKAYTDVANAGVDPIVHFLTFGADELRTIETVM